MNGKLQMNATSAVMVPNCATARIGIRLALGRSGEKVYASIHNKMNIFFLVESVTELLSLTILSIVLIDSIACIDAQYNTHQAKGSASTSWFAYAVNFLKLLIDNFTTFNSN